MYIEDLLEVQLFFKVCRVIQGNNKMIANATWKQNLVLNLVLFLKQNQY